MNWKAIFGWLIVLFALYWIITDPTAAAAFVNGIARFLGAAAHNIGVFFGAIGLK